MGTLHFLRPKNGHLQQEWDATGTPTHADISPSPHKSLIKLQSSTPVKGYPATWCSENQEGSQIPSMRRNLKNKQIMVYLMRQ